MLMLDDIPRAHGLYDPACEKDSCGVGFIAHIRGQASHQMVLDADEMLQRMDHRGACGCEPNTGDGSGILVAMPRPYFADIAVGEWGVDSLEPGRFAVGNFFLPLDRSRRAHCLSAIQTTVARRGQQWIGSRPLPIDLDGANLGMVAHESAPYFVQIFVGAHPDISEEEFERQLYLIRKQVQAELREVDHLNEYYCCSLSNRIIVYKGMLTSWQLRRFYADLRDPNFQTHLAMVHSRFSTNTFPSWSRATSALDESQR